MEDFRIKAGSAGLRLVGALAMSMLALTTSAVGRPLPTSDGAIAAPAILPADLSPLLPPPLLTPPAAAPSTLNTSSDTSDRMTVPVMINGKGPFDFVIDTGADRTVISQELATRLNLPPGHPAQVHATSGMTLEHTAILDTLQVGPRRIDGIEAPLLARANLGADGMLGIDTLRGQSMVMDFAARRLTVRTSYNDVFDNRTIVVYGKNRYGQLILVDASVRGVPIYVILDSGAQNSVANTTLRRMLERRDPMRRGVLDAYVLSVTGGSTSGEFAILPSVTLGGVTLHNLPVAFADLHTFAQFDLADRPAMLLGMDVLRAFDRVAVDFGNKRVSFRMR